MIETFLIILKAALKYTYKYPSIVYRYKIKESVHLKFTRFNIHLISVITQ